MHLFHRNRKIGFLSALHKSIRFGAQGKGLNDRGVRLIPRSFLTIGRRHMLQLIEIISPII